MDVTAPASSASEDETYIMLTLDTRLSQLNRAFHDDVDNIGSCRLAPLAERRLDTRRILVERRSLEAAPLNEKLSTRGPQPAELRPIASDAQSLIDSAALTAVLENDGRVSSRELATNGQRKLLLVLAKTQAWQNYCAALEHYLDRLALPLRAGNNDEAGSGHLEHTFSAPNNGAAVQDYNCPMHLQIILDRILVADAALARFSFRGVQPNQRWGQLRMSLYFDATFCTAPNGPVEQDWPQQVPTAGAQRNSSSAICRVRRSVTTAVPWYAS